MKFTAAANRSARLVMAGLALLFSAVPAKPDTLVLTNGDTFSGTILTMDQTAVQIKSDILGELKIPRNRISRINLRESAPKPTVAFSGTNSTNRLLRAFATSPTNRADAAVQSRMRDASQQVDPKVMSQVQQQMLGDSGPEANRLFNEMVTGLMSGSLTAEDIRNQARKAIKDIDAAKKDLGDDDAIGELLDGYLGILQNFVQENDPPSAPAAKSAPNPQPPATPAK